MSLISQRPGGRWPAHHVGIVTVMLAAALLNDTALHDAVKTGRLGYLTVVLVGLLIAFTAFHRTVTVDTFVPLDGSFAASPARGTTPLSSEVGTAPVTASNTDGRGAVTSTTAATDNVTNTDLPAQWCAICRQTKPIRAKHCLICKRCVLKFDHHCPYFQCCIGERNHGYFMVATLGHSALAVYCGVLLSRVVPENVVVPGRPEGPLLLIIFVISMMLSIVGAFGFGVMALVHMPMLFSGKTSYEYLRGRRLEYISNAHHNPFDEGYYGNALACCAASFGGAQPRDWSALLRSTDRATSPAVGDEDSMNLLVTA